MFITLKGTKYCVDIFFLIYLVWKVLSVVYIKILQNFDIACFRPIEDLCWMLKEILTVMVKCMA